MLLISSKKTQIFLISAVVFSVFVWINPGEGSNREGAISRAEAAGFRREDVTTNPFILASWSRISGKGKPLTVYIEGDGSAWKSRHQLSANPTPRNPVALELALRDASANVIYLARPCQYVKDSACAPVYWSDRRFSEEVIRSTSEAIDHFVGISGAKEVHLVGFSGGAAVAVLVAARRGDVATLRTIAGNLDPDMVNVSHSVSPLKGSLNPIEYASALAHLPQRHFIGTKDKVVPSSVAHSFVHRAADNTCVHITEVEGAGHDTGWNERWEELLRMDVACTEPTK
jgi:pimeloyl-ACP methyl ester carboxylesterase